MSDADSTQTDLRTLSSGEKPVVIPLLAEEFSVRKQTLETGRVRVTTVTHQHEELVDELLAREHVEVDRVAIGKPIDAMPAVRDEGGTLVVPVVEEVLVVERRLMLKEELHIRRVRSTERHQERVLLHKQEALISRLPTEVPTKVESSISTDGPKIHSEEK